MPIDNERLENFKSYYRLHYKKILEKLSSDFNHVYIKDEHDRHMLSFLMEDIESIIGTKEEGNEH